MTPGTLYIVATPIGNLEDITFRAVRTLKEVALVAAEDTRHSRKLLNHLGITTPLTSYYDHNRSIKGPQIIETLLKGKDVALISDAGTPCISDPGYQLVRDARSKGIRVVPVPGVSAAITALSVAGLPTDRFTFAGFPPAKQGKRRAFLAELKTATGTLVLYEAPHRLADCLTDIAAVMGERQLVVARELTKFYEELLTGNAAQLATAVQAGKERGEVVILIAATDAEATEEPDIQMELQLLLDKGHTVKEVAAMLAARSGLPRRELYARALLLRGTLTFETESCSD